ncbi:MAG TPA: hypothetical protein VJT73_15730 [Polyangiaceae bacterium]|nr:hypothetical protein [Polyangiaceae bacterium]
MGAIGPLPVLNAGWAQLGLSAFMMHDQAVPPIPPVPGVPGIIEGPAFMGWPPGMLSHKTELTVMSDGNPTVQQGHDIGYMIMHLQAPMNSLTALHTLLSKHKVVFPVSTVKAGGKPIGTYLFFLLGEICSNPLSLPSGVLILIKCTVWTSMGIGDLLIGIAVIAIDMAFDYVWNKVKGKIPKIPGQKHLQVLGGLSLGEMLTGGGARLVGGYLLREGGNKVFQHILKSWVLSPLLTGLPFGKSGIGRGNWAFHPFFGGRQGSDAHH